jgi:hypothetical protein
VGCCPVPELRHSWPNEHGDPGQQCREGPLRPPGEPEAKDRQAVPGEHFKPRATLPSVVPRAHPPTRDTARDTSGQRSPRCMKVAFAPESRLASRGGHHAGRWPPGAGRPAGAPPAPGPGARSPGNASGSPPGSGVANSDSSRHGAAADRRAPRRSAGATRGADGDGRGSDRRGTGGGAELGASITSQMEGDTVPDAPGSRSGWMRGGKGNRT